MPVLMAAFGKDPFSSMGLHGEPVASEELKGWIDDWLAFHAEGTVNAVAEAAAAADDSNAAAQAAQAAAQPLRPPRRPPTLPPSGCRRPLAAAEAAKRPPPTTPSCRPGRRCH